MFTSISFFLSFSLSSGRKATKTLSSGSVNLTISHSLAAPPRHSRSSPPLQTAAGSEMPCPSPTLSDISARAAGAAAPPEIGSDCRFCAGLPLCPATISSGSTWPHPHVSRLLMLRRCWRHRTQLDRLVWILGKGAAWQSGRSERRPGRALC